MRRILATVSIVCLGVLCLGCESESGEAKQAIAGSESEPGLVEGLITRAKGVWESQSDKLAYEGGEEGDHVTSKENDPIVRCYVNGGIEFTNQSRCGNRGGRGARMALKAKNDR